MSQPEEAEGHDESTQDATDEKELCVLARCQWWPSRGFRLPYASVQRAVRNSCEVCTVFDKAILAVVDGCLPELFRGPQDENERTKILDTLVVVYLWCTIRRGRSTRKDSINVVGWMKMEISGRLVCIDFFRDEDEQPEFMLRDFTFPLKPTYGPTTCSDRTFERARGWLRDCLEHHDCKALAREWAPTQSRPPRRLLDLHAETIRLFDTDTAQSHFDAPYVCLSHRWGDSRHRRMTSTVHTIQKHMQGISWDDLPRTFQDAVTICRRMSIDYLWIDSLCILQEFDGILDDEASLRETRADFAQENSFMATTYQNSLFTISANISTNMDSGIFCKRSFTSHKIHILDKKGVSACLRIRESTWHDSKPTELETRGWTLQEYILPPRLLIFGHFDVSWKCPRMHSCECGGMNYRLQPRYPPLQSEALRATANEDILAWWRQMVELYSRRTLTNEQDKLPALSGLAQLYHAATGHTYLAGLWKEILYEDLCWYHRARNTTEPIPSIRRRPRQFRSPSWSWASLDTYYDDEDRCFWWNVREERENDRHLSLIKICTIFEVNCKPRTNDAFGEVDPDAFIEIGTRLISATITTRLGRRPERRVLESGRPLPWTLSFDEDDPNRVVGSCFPDCRPEDDDVMIGDAVYCAPILEKLTTLQSSVGCLILKCVGGQRYRRVGFCFLCKQKPLFRQVAQDGGMDTYVVMMEKIKNIEDYEFKYSQETKVRIVIV